MSDTSVDRQDSGLGIVELFTVPAIIKSANWEEIVEQQKCSYTNSKCFKTRKSESETSIGTCTVSHNVKNPKNVIICPARFLERNQIFFDCIHLLGNHEPGNELHRISEVSIPGGSVDFCLASVYKGKIVDFVGIELQTVDTTGSVWPTRQKYLRSVGLDVAIGKDGTYGMNWKMTAKTILVQIHHKLQTFEHVNRHFVLVLQDHLLKEIQLAFNFDHIGSTKKSDPMHIHSYSLIENLNAYKIELSSRLSTDSGGIATSLGLQASPKVELDIILKNLEQRMLNLNRSGRSTLLSL